jgi:hypothetical protein
MIQYPDRFCHVIVHLFAFSPARSGMARLLPMDAKTSIWSKPCMS